MKKTLKSSLAFILALVMLFSCAFASVSAVEAEKAESISLSEIPGKITDAAEYAYSLYEEYVPESVKDINANVAGNVTDGIKNLLTLYPSNITVAGKEYNVASLIGLISALSKMSTDKEKTAIAMRYLEMLFTKIIKFIADLIPMPHGLTKLEDYKPESKNFYKGSETFATQAAADAKWQLGYSQASLVPDDVLNGNYYLGGYLLQNFPSNTVETVLDDMKVRTIVIDDKLQLVAYGVLNILQRAASCFKRGAVFVNKNRARQ